MTYLRKDDFFVKDVPHSDAIKLIQEFHYAKGGSNTAVYLHGLFRRGSKELLGVIQWLPPTKVAAISVNREHWQRVLSLSRLAIKPDCPTNSASFLIGQSIKKIKKEGKYVSLVTYADCWKNHTGQIYKATNWTYVGLTSSTPKWICPVTGKQVAQKATKNRVKREMVALGYEKVGSFPKHKYVMHLRDKPLDFQTGEVA